VSCDLLHDAALLVTVALDLETRFRPVVLQVGQLLGVDGATPLPETNTHKAIN